MSVRIWFSSQINSVIGVNDFAQSHTPIYYKYHPETGSSLSKISHNHSMNMEAQAALFQHTVGVGYANVALTEGVSDL